MSDYSQSDTDEEMTPPPIPTIQSVFEPVLRDSDTGSDSSSQDTFERTFIYESSDGSDDDDHANNINSLTNHVMQLDSESNASTETSSEMAHELEDALEIEPEALDYDSSSSDDPPYGPNTSIQKSMAISKGRRHH